MFLFIGNITFWNLSLLKYFDKIIFPGWLYNNQNRAILNMPSPITKQEIKLGVETCSQFNTLSDLPCWRL